MNAALANSAVDFAWQIEPLTTLAGGARDRQPRSSTATRSTRTSRSPRCSTRPTSPRAPTPPSASWSPTCAPLRDYNDAFGEGIGRADVAQILAKHTTVKDLALYDRLIPAGLDPDGRLNVAGIRDDLALYGRLGCITRRVADVEPRRRRVVRQLRGGRARPYQQ